MMLKFAKALTLGCPSCCVTSKNPNSKKKMVEEKTVQKLLTDMTNIMDKKRPAESKLPKSVNVAVMRLKESALHNTKAAQKLLDFANIKAEEKLLKINTTDVPEGILPEGYEGVLHDIKISGYRADDETYSNHPDIRQNIPRGTTLMYLKKDYGKEVIKDVVIYGIRKFTSDIDNKDHSQEQEINDQWQKYFLKHQEEAQQIVCMKKINGEAGHFSARIIDGQFYIITGSKTVHMIIKEKKDIDKYVGDRFSVAKVVAKCVWDTLHALEEDHYTFLLHFLCLTKCTAICEILQPEYQHIINISKLERPHLNMISFTPSASDGDLSSLIALPPHHTLDLLSSLGFNVPLYTTIQAGDVQKYRDEIRQGKHGHREEGEVLYFLSKDEETIGLVKTKTVWYIMLRALREKIVYAFNASRWRNQKNLEDSITFSHKRFADIQKWLQFSNSYLEDWKKLAKSFIMWMAEEVKEGHVVVEDIRRKYPLLWDKFLEMTNQEEPRTTELYQDMHEAGT